MSIKNKKFMIDDLFENKLNNYNIESRKDEWLELDIKLTKNNFMKFSFYHFNIYYASVFLISALFSIAAGINYFFLSHSLPPYQHNIMNIHTKNNNKINNAINYSIDTSNTSKLILADSTINKDVNNKRISNSNIIINSKVNDLKHYNSNKTNNNLNKKIKSNDNTSNTKKQIVDTIINTENKTILIKKDNVIIRDTVIRYKKRKKRKNNN